MPEFHSFHEFRSSMPILRSEAKASPPWHAIVLVMLAAFPHCSRAESAAAQSPSGHPTALLFATGSMIGAQTTLRAMFRDGKTHMPQSVVDCVSQLKPQVLESFYESMIEGVLSPEEIRESDAFWDSEAGLRKRNAMLVATYLDRGETPPISIPAALAESDNTAFERFSATETAKKLERLEHSNALNLALRARIKELFDPCLPHTTIP